MGLSVAPADTESWASPIGDSAAAFEALRVTAVPDRILSE
jgi:hypothetical protein